MNLNQMKYYGEDCNLVASTTPISNLYIKEINTKLFQLADFHGIEDNNQELSFL